MKSNVILRNMMSLVSEGAFGGRGTVEPMSAFKWDVLYRMSVIEDVAPYVFDGLRAHAGDADANITREVYEKFAASEFSNRDAVVPVLDIDNLDTAHLSFFVKRYLLKDIVYKERHSIDTSRTSLDLLSLILQTTNVILRGGLRLRPLIMIGVFLRTQGQNVDFVKLETWIQRLKLQRMASFQASVLVDGFGFAREEFPYVRKWQGMAGRRLWFSAEREYRAQRHERTFSAYNVSNCLRFYKYARSEAFCKATSTLLRSLSEIEE